MYEIMSAALFCDLTVKNTDLLKIACILVLFGKMAGAYPESCTMQTDYAKRPNGMAMEEKKRKSHLPSHPNFYARK